MLWPPSMIASLRPSCWFASVLLVLPMACSRGGGGGTPPPVTPAPLRGIVGATPDGLIEVALTGNAVLGQRLGSFGFSGITHDEIVDIYYGLDRSNGAITAIDFQPQVQRRVTSSLPFVPLPYITHDPVTSHLFVVDSGTNELVRVHAFTGQSTILGVIDEDLEVRGLAFDIIDRTVRVLARVVSVPEHRLVTLDDDASTLQSRLLSLPVGTSSVEGLDFVVHDGTARILVDGRAASLVEPSGVVSMLPSADPVSFSDITTTRNPTDSPSARGLFGFLGEFLVSIDPDLGTAQLSAALGLVSIEGAAYDAVNDRTFIVDAQLEEVWSVRNSTGLAARLQRFVDSHGLAFDSVVDQVYAVRSDGELLAMSAAGGGGLLALGNTTLTDVEGLALDPLERRLFAVQASSDRLFEIDLANGQATDLGATGFAELSGLGFDVATRMLVATDTAGFCLVEIDPDAPASARAIAPIGLPIRGLGARVAPEDG